MRCAVLSFKDLVLQLFLVFFCFFSLTLSWSSKLQWEVAELVSPYLAAKMDLKWLFLLFWLCPQDHQLTWSQEFESKLFWRMSEDGVEVKFCARKRHSGKLRWLGMAWQSCPKGSEDE